MDGVIILTRLGGREMAVNPDLIERAEPTPDTVITMMDGHKLVVAESLHELVELVRVWRASVSAEAYAQVHRLAPSVAAEPGPGGRDPVPLLASVPDLVPISAARLRRSAPDESRDADGGLDGIVTPLEGPASPDAPASPYGADASEGSHSRGAPSPGSGADGATQESISLDEVTTRTAGQSAFVRRLRHSRREG